MTKISFQGEFGAYSHLACIEVFSDCTPIPCETFEAALEHVHKGMSDYAMLPVQISNRERSSNATIDKTNS